MKSLVLIKNIQERQSIRRCVEEKGEVLYPKHGEEFLSQPELLNSIDVFILDESYCDCDQWLGSISRSRKDLTPPIILVLVGQQESENQARTGESERVIRYSNMGAELMLYRPFPIVDLQKHIELAAAWHANLPPWVKLLRVSRSFVQNQEPEKVLPGLEALNRRSPDDLSIGILYTKALLTCASPNYERALQVLVPLRKKFPFSAAIMQMMSDIHFKLGQHLEGARLRLQVFSITERTEYAEGIEEQLFGESQLGQLPFEQILELLDLVTAQGTVADRVRTNLLKLLSGRATTVAEYDRFLVKLLQHRTLAPLFLDDLLTIRLKLGERIKGPPSKEALAVREAHDRFINVILEVDPGRPDILEFLIPDLLEAGDLPRAESRLRLARMATKLSVEYYLCMSKISIYKKQLIEAARFLENAKALKGSDREIEKIRALETNIQELQTAQTHLLKRST